MLLAQLPIQMSPITKAVPSFIITFPLSELGSKGASFPVPLGVSVLF